MLSLESRRWVCFVLSDVFDIKPTANGIDKVKLIPGKGVYPYVTRSDVNNGVNAFVCEQPGYELNVKNCITVGSDTQTVFYQPADFYTGNNVNILRNDELNADNAKFLVPMMKRALSVFCWGHAATLTRLKRTRIMLPVDDVGSPDWSFMEEYIREREQKMLREYIAQVREKVKAGEHLTLDSRTWRGFYLRDLFSIIQRGKRLKTDDHIHGNIPYVSSSALNNGVDDFIGNTDGVRKFNDCITIANSGSVGKSFFHEYEFIASDHVTALQSPNMDKYIYLFIATMTRRLEEKYSFNREINETRINRERVMLPVDDSGQPDYSFMHDYMMHIEASRLLAYLEAKAQNNSSS